VCCVRGGEKELLVTNRSSMKVLRRGALGHKESTFNPPALGKVERTGKDLWKGRGHVHSRRERSTISLKGRRDLGLNWGVTFRGGRTLEEKGISAMPKRDGGCGVEKELSNHRLKKGRVFCFRKGELWHLVKKVALSHQKGGSKGAGGVLAKKKQKQPRHTKGRFNQQ